MFTNRIISVVSAFAVVVVWYVIAELEVVPPFFVPHPRQVWSTFVDVVTNGYRGLSLWAHMGDSMFRLGVAYLLAVVTATPLGLLSAYNDRIRAAIDWLIEFYRPLPPLAYYTVLVIWLGIDNESKIALLYLAGFAPIYVAAVDGVRGIPVERLHVIRSLGANKWQIFRHAIFPSTLPALFTGMRVSLGFTYTTLVAAEMVAASSGIGWMVLDASKFLRSDIIFTGIILMGITALVLDWCVRTLEQKFVPWRGRTE